MSVRLLLFSGKWEYEGKFGALETSESLLIFAAGQDYFSNNITVQQVGRDYLKIKKEKVKAIVLTNTSIRNVGLLEDICYDLGTDIPIYVSHHSKTILKFLFPELRHVVTTEEEKDWNIGDFVVNFLPVSSYLVGNQGIACHYSDYSFYFLEDFCFTSLSNNTLFFQTNFLAKLTNFVNKKRVNSYLVTSCQNIHWYNNNSLLLAAERNLLPTNLGGNLLFILYETDWIHIIELLEIVQQWQKKISLINRDFFAVLKKILSDNNDPLKKIVVSDQENWQSEDSTLDTNIYLLLINPKNPVEKMNYYWQKISLKKQSLRIVLGLPAEMGGQEKLARLLDFLYSKTEKIIDLSKNKEEYLRLGISLADLKLLLSLFQPTSIIVLNHSYENDRILNRLSESMLFMKNNHYLDLSNKKMVPLSNSKNPVVLEERLAEQRQRLGRSGVLIICLVASWKNKKLYLEEVTLEKIAISPHLALDKIEGKIRKWWDTKVVNNLTESDSEKDVRKTVERRLNVLVERFTGLEYGLELKDSMILLFV